jgi:chemotaxis protein CheC
MTVLSLAKQDALLEIGNIGAGHAASSLAALLQRPIALSTPTIATPPLSSLLAEPHRTVVVVDMGVEGDVRGHILVLFDREAANELAIAFVRRACRIENPTEADIESTFQEFANIIAGSYLAALCQLTGLALNLMTPLVLSGTRASVLPQLASLEDDQNVLVIDSHFVSEERVVPGQIVLIPDETSIESLLAPLSAKARVEL